MGAGGGCLLAWGGLKALVAALPKSTFPDEADIHLNLRVLAATARPRDIDGADLRPGAGN